eukprot:TRINITY_DN520_c0_g1_i7.p1 TRINITY_DN520_c0_g1~~TRINITY_DN520_c0_g1_i7.p1  ORF type:complete len:287 (-),score=73.50 TRINITY_DN520_c0_g1_i7:171-1031(-)
MNCLVKILLLTFAAVMKAQTTLQINAAGALPTGSSATAQGTGSGANVVGDATVEVTDTVARSSTIITATGPSTPAPKPTPKPKPAAKPRVVTQVLSLPQFPVCSAIKDKECPKIDNFKYCGFCIIQSYPVKGFACEYTKTYVPKAGKNYANEYEELISPLCKCDGKFILEAKECPSCDKLLAVLLKCAGFKKSSGVIEIPQKCLKQVGATEKILKACGFLGAPKVAPKPVVIVDQKKPVVVVEPKKTAVVVPTTIVVPVVSTATATATATASGSGSAVATATAGGK